jgi:hypothetical protein
MRILLAVATTLVLTSVPSCESNSSRMRTTPADGTFVVKPVDNPEFHDNELFRAYEDYYSPRVKRLRERYKLDDVVRSETDEWRRILLLRQWIHTHIRIEDQHPTSSKPEAFDILDKALEGGGFHCEHFSIVQDAVLNSFGYVARRLGCGPGLKEEGGHHGVNEVWVNEFAKWVIIDAKNDLHFEKDGVPLSALEIRDEVWKDGGKSVVPVFGVDGKGPGEADYRAFDVNPTTYRWCSWETATNRFTAWPSSLTSTLVMLDDDIFRNNTWYRDGEPHWAYNTPFLIGTTQRGWIEWTPNVIASNVKINGAKANISLTSFTPNFKTYQMKRGDGKWTDCETDVELPLTDASNRFTFRSVNLFAVTGPEHVVQIDRQ